MTGSSYEGQPLRESRTIRAKDLEAGFEGQNLLLVTGPFGFTGVYPLVKFPLHCPVYFLKVAPSDGSKTVVTENTEIELRSDDATRCNTEICCTCTNKSCPPNCNPSAAIEDRPGELYL